MSVLLIRRVPAKVGSEDAVELTNEIQLRIEHGWYRDKYKYETTKCE